MSLLMSTVTETSSKDRVGFQSQMAFNIALGEGTTVLRMISSTSLAVSVGWGVCVGDGSGMEVGVLIAVGV